MQFAIISILLLHCEAFLLAFPISTVIYILFPQFALRSFFIVPYVVDSHSISRMWLLWNFQSYLWNFHSMDNIMRWCIRFNFRPIRVVINLAERQTDRPGTDIMQGRGPVSNTAIIHTQSTGDPWPAIQNSRMKWEDSQWLTDCDLLWHPSVWHWDQTGMQVLLERPCLVHNNAGHKQLKSVFTAAHLDL